MNDKELGQQMYDKALAFMNLRFPVGWGGVAAMHTEDGQILISVYLESPNDSAGLCIETGAMCEAQKYNLNITHSMCLTRQSETEKPIILTACGLCQERLRYWGDGVKVAVSNPENEIIFKSLKELNPHYWADAFGDDADAERYAAGICVPRDWEAK